MSYAIIHDIAYDTEIIFLKVECSIQNWPCIVAMHTLRTPREGQCTKMETKIPCTSTFFYIFQHLQALSFQYMHAYRVTKDTDIKACVHTTFPAILGSPSVQGAI